MGISKGSICDQGGEMASGDWQRRLADWLRGRQGPDDLATFCVNVAIVVVVVNLFARTSWLGWVALALVVYAMFRIQSKNLGSRARIPIGNIRKSRSRRRRFEGTFR